MILSRHLWLHQFGATPSPVTLAGLRTDAVETNLRLGLTAVEGLRDAAVPVGPLLCCPSHGNAFIPVPAGTVRWWSAAHSRCHTSIRACTSWSDQPLERRCVCLWLIPPGTPYLTDPQSLHDRLSLSRSRPPPATVCAA